MLVVTEKYYEGDMSKGDPVGEIHQVVNLQLIKGTMCTTQRKIVRHSVKSFSNMTNHDMVPVISLLPVMQAGQIENPCSFFNIPLVPMPSGSCCDCGRRVTVTRMTFAQSLTMTEVVTGGAPGEATTDAEVQQEFRLRTDEELAALPTRRTFWGHLEVVDETNADATTAAAAPWGSEMMVRD